MMLTARLDSIAGQMAALKGQPTADPDKPVRNRKVCHCPSQYHLHGTSCPLMLTPSQLKEKLAQEESDYESNTDEDEESESETDTDTDSEAEEAAKKAKAWW